MDEYAAGIEAWHRNRIDRLRAPTGWLAIVDRVMLEEGENVLPIGVVRLSAGEVTLDVPEGLVVLLHGKPVRHATIRADEEGTPDPLLYEGRSYELVRRRDLTWMRVRDPDNAGRLSFTGIDRFPIDPAWRVPARFIPHDAPQEMIVDTPVGPETKVTRGALVFDFAGVEHRLDCMDLADPPRLFVLFSDASNGTDTYDGGRLVYTPMPDAEGRVLLDFNRSTNPPCAIVPYVVCLLPPPQNRLPFRVEAGEKVPPQLF